MNHVHALLAAGWVALARDNHDRRRARRRGRVGGGHPPRPRVAGRVARAARARGARSAVTRSSGSTRPRESGATSGIRRRGSRRAHRAPGGRRRGCRTPSTDSARSACAVTVRQPRTRHAARPRPPSPFSHWGGSASSGRRAGAARRMAIAEGARPPEDPRRSPRSSYPARRPDGGAVARAEPGTAREPAVGASQHRARRPRSGQAVRAGALRRCRQERGLAAARERSVDVEEFLAAAGAALSQAREGDPEAHARLVAAEAAYVGDFLEEDAYEDWALGLREEARAIYTEVVRALAEGAAAPGTPTLRRDITSASSSATPTTSPPTSASSPLSRLRAGTARPDGTSAPTARAWTRSASNPRHFPPAGRLTPL